MVNKNIKKYLKKRRYSTSVVIRKMQMKTTKICYERNLLEWLKLEWLTVPNIGDDLEQCNSHMLVMKRESVASVWKIVWLGLLKLNISLGFSYLFPCFCPREIESISPPQNLYLKFSSSIFRHNFNLETPPLFINCWADK